MPAPRGDSNTVSNPCRLSRSFEPILDIPNHPWFLGYLLPSMILKSLGTAKEPKQISPLLSCPELGLQSLEIKEWFSSAYAIICFSNPTSAELQFVRISAWASTMVPYPASKPSKRLKWSESISENRYWSIYPRLSSKLLQQSNRIGWQGIKLGGHEPQPQACWARWDGISSVAIKVPM